MKIKSYSRKFVIKEAPKTKRQLWKDLSVGDIVQIEYTVSYVAVKFPSDFMDYNPVTFNSMIQTLEDNGMKYENIEEEE